MFKSRAMLCFLYLKTSHFTHKNCNFPQPKNMERTLKEIQEALYSSNLDELEKNLDKLLDAKHEHSFEQPKREE